MTTTVKKFPRYGPDLSAEQKAQILDEIAEHLPLMIYIRDFSNDKFEYVSGYWEELTGVPVDRWLNDPMAWVEMVHPEDRAYGASVAELARKEFVASRDTRVLHRDGSIHWIHGWLGPIMDDSGNPVRMVGVSTDVTVRKAREQELRDTQLELEHKLRARDQAMVAMTQELERLRAELGRRPEEVKTALPAFESLTRREKEVFALVVRGARNKEIAADLDIALATVKAHRAKIMTKFGVDNVARLVTLAVRAGLVDD